MPSPLSSPSSPKQPPRQPLLISPQQRQRFVIELTLYTLGGWLFGYRSAESLTQFPMPLELFTQLLRYFAWSYWGVCIGLVQWFALKDRLYRGGRWIWANAAGWLLLSAIATAVLNSGSTNLPSDIPTISDFIVPGGLESAPPELLTQLRLEPLLASGLGGLCLGIAQWFVLRDAIAPSLWWVMVPAIGNLLSQLACNSVFTVLPSEHLAYCIRILVFGLVLSFAFCLCRRSNQFTD
jgi:hypothetical protein